MTGNIQTILFMGKHQRKYIMEKNRYRWQLDAKAKKILPTDIFSGAHSQGLCQLSLNADPY
ncbi:MAG: hypothetical protein CSB21_00650 [Deltaproteobacteria bacterium]|nr:MAG: hypothetical protein CSB21_00650 [Deltaproteobacteria bacterium]